MAFTRKICSISLTQMYNLVILWQGDQGSGGLKEEINVRLKESKGPKFTNLYRG